MNWTIISAVLSVGAFVSLRTLVVRFLCAGHHWRYNTAALDALVGDARQLVSDVQLQVPKFALEL